MLQLEQNTVVSLLDTKKNEDFPQGTLEDSRTWFWKLIGSPVPRPVCVVSATEYIHESARLRADKITQHDTYDRQSRRGWVTAMEEERPAMPNREVILPREAYESTVGGLQRPDPAAPHEITKDLDICSWLVSLVSARS
jgi:hypothetical protein